MPDDASISTPQIGCSTERTYIPPVAGIFLFNDLFIFAYLYKSETNAENAVAPF